MTTTLNDVMTTDIVACDAGTPLHEVARLMRDRDIGDVLVTDRDRLAGIVTDRDIVVRCLAGDADGARAAVSKACSPDITTGTPDMAVEDAARLMADHAIRRLPVVHDGRAVGIVSLGDLAVAADPRSALGGISAARPNA
jgi:CBS domain-containing protein